MLILSGCGRQDYQARNDFISSYREAHRQGDLDGLLDLYHWEGVEEGYRRTIRLSLYFEQEYPLEQVAIIPLDADDAYSGTPGWRPNLQPVARLLLVFDNPEHLTSTLLLGKKDGQYRLVNPMPR